MRVARWGDGVGARCVPGKGATVKTFRLAKENAQSERRGGKQRKIFLSAFLYILCASAFTDAGQLRAADWREQVTRKVGDFPPLRPLEAKYKFGWSAFSAGR